MLTTLLEKSTATIKGSIAINVLGLGTSTPPFRFTQKESLEFILANFKIADTTKHLYERAFRNKSIEHRHFGVDHISEVLEKDHDKINQRFEKWAVKLSTKALRQALENSALVPYELGFLAVTTCTGYLCPGLSSYLIETCELNPSIVHTDIVGMGCGAALPALEQAAAFVQTHPDSCAAVVSTEICSAALFSNDQPDIVISNFLFADGSAAVILSNKKGLVGFNGFPTIKQFESLVIPEWRNTLKFKTVDGYLCNVLGKDVPDQAAAGTKQIITKLLLENNLSIDQISHWIVHAGGEKILNAIGNNFGLRDDDLESSRQVLKNFGNMSSPSCLFVLQEEIRSRPAKSGEWGILTSFGAGFSVHAALLSY